MHPQFHFFFVLRERKPTYTQQRNVHTLILTQAWIFDERGSLSAAAVANIGTHSESGAIHRRHPPRWIIVLRINSSVIFWPLIIDDIRVIQNYFHKIDFPAKKNPKTSLLLWSFLGFFFVKILSPLGFYDFVSYPFSVNAIWFPWQTQMNWVISILCEFKICFAEWRLVKQPRKHRTNKNYSILTFHFHHISTALNHAQKGDRKSKCIFVSF